MSNQTNKHRRYWTILQPMPADMLVMAAKGAEMVGVHGIFAPQVYGPPFVTLGAVAAVTERVQLASGIAIAAVRSPFETAMAAIDLDRISGGRFILGLGTSVHAWTTGVFGAPRYKPVTHLRETIAAIRHIVGGAHKGLEPFEGEYYRGDYRTVAHLVPDEMVRAFVAIGPPEKVREQVEPYWDFADSLCVVPPVYTLPPEKLLYYTQAIAETFYG